MVKHNFEYYVMPNFYPFCRVEVSVDAIKCHWRHGATTLRPQLSASNKIRLYELLKNNSQLASACQKHPLGSFNRVSLACHDLYSNDYGVGIGGG